MEVNDNSFKFHDDYNAFKYENNNLANLSQFTRFLRMFRS